MGGGVDEDLSGAGTLRGCAAVWRRGVEEVEVGMGGVAGVPAGGDALGGILSC